jgi:hypothetical protein
MNCSAVVFVEESSIFSKFSVILLVLGRHLQLTPDGLET